MGDFTKKKLAVLSGAGVSAESGIATFRDHGGLWESYRIEDVATPEAWHRDPELVTRFYNMRRAAALKADPNEAHRILAELEAHFDVHIVTQNIDDLHERAGSTKVLHLHGEIFKMRCPEDETEILEIRGDIGPNTQSKKGLMMRPHIVWFGEAVPAMEQAEEIFSQSDIVLVIGTSLQVYPAAGLVYAAPPHAKIYLIDPVRPAGIGLGGIHCIEEVASKGMKIFKEMILTEGAC